MLYIINVGCGYTVHCNVGLGSFQQFSHLCNTRCLNDYVDYMQCSMDQTNPLSHCFIVGYRTGDQKKVSLLIITCVKQQKMTDLKKLWHSKFC